MNRFEERLKKQVERTKQEDAERAAREFEKSLTSRYLSLSNSTPEMTVTESTSSWLKITNDSFINDKPVPVTEISTTSVVLSSLSPSKNVFDKRVSDAVERTKKEQSRVAYHVEQEHLYQNLTHPVPVVNLSIKSLSTPAPPLATMSNNLHNGLSVRHTGEGTLVTVNLNTYYGLAGLLGVAGLGNKLYNFLAILVICLNLVFSLNSVKIRCNSDGSCVPAGLVIKKVQILLL